MSEQLKGIAAAPGVSIGKAFLLGKEEFIIPKTPIPEEKIPLEIMRFEDTLIKTRRQILDLQKKISEELGKEGGRNIRCPPFSFRRSPTY